MKNLLERKTPYIVGNKRYPASFRNLPTFTIALLAMSVLAGCGGGGSGGTIDVSANDGTPPITPDPITPDPITPDPITPDPVTPDPIVLETPLSQLYGRTIFTFFFSANEGQMFAFDASFGAEDLIDDGLGNLMLTDTVSAFLSESPGSAFVVQQPERMTCLFEDESERFSCRVVLVGEGGTSANFTFLLRDDDQPSTGSFTACTPDQSNVECTNELRIRPDGWVTVEVFSLSLNSRNNLTQLDDAKNSPNGSSILPYLQYENQGSLGLQ